MLGNNKQGKQVTVVAIERDGLSVRTLTIFLQILQPGIDVVQAVKNACTEYVQTPEGANVYSYNCGSFNWADFVSNVPNEICEKYGFRRIDDSISEIEVNWDEHLVGDGELSQAGDEI